MKKILPVLSIVVFLSAGCNLAKQTNTPTPTTIRPVTFKEVQVKSGVVLSGYEENVYNFLTAKGHYLLWTYEDDKIQYDGRKIYQGNIDAVGLSNNGLHYAYAVNPDPVPPVSRDSMRPWDESSLEGKRDDLYIDGKKITSDINISNINLTDDGQHYLYTTNTEIIKDGQSIFHNEHGFEKNSDLLKGVKLSSDGSIYMARVDYPPSGAEEEVILNGKVIATPVDSKPINDLANDHWFVALSDNGKHYIYQNSNGFFVDGKLKFPTDPNRAVGVSQITDDGHYLYFDPIQGKWYIDTKPYPLNISAINSDATHYMYVMNSKIYVDGIITNWIQSNPGEFFEMDSNILYGYNLIK